MSYELLWFQAFVITCAIEVPIVMLFLRRAMPSYGRRLALGLGLQVVTHPALWFVVPQWSPYWSWVLVAELGVFLVEALGIALALRLRPTRGRAVGLGLAASFTANAVSTAVGLLT